MNHTTNTQQIRMVSDLNTINTNFINRKMALAANALFKRGMSWSQIAKELEYSNAQAIQFIASRHGDK